MDAQWYCPPDVGALYHTSTYLPASPLDYEKIISHRSQFPHGCKHSYAANKGEKVAIYQSGGASTAGAQDGST